LDFPSPQITRSGQGTSEEKFWEVLGHLNTLNARWKFLRFWRGSNLGHRWQSGKPRRPSPFYLIKFFFAFMKLKQLYLNLEFICYFDFSNFETIEYFCVGKSSMLCKILGFFTKFIVFFRFDKTFFVTTKNQEIKQHFQLSYTLKKVFNS
jgi:hypothetical protein